ncbi:MAG: HD domain-containing protein [Butyrivibrio sp.]|nr:HD domain-containing protein [Butyrivibrio sp.]
MIEIIVYYWPRLLVGAWFALTYTFLTLRGESKKWFLPRFLVLFAISGTIVAIATERISDIIHAVYINDLLKGADPQVEIGINALFKISTDAIAYIIPIYIFTLMLKEHWTVAATVYLMYVILDRLCLVMAVSAISYFLIFICIIMVIAVFLRTNLMYVVEHSRSIEWRPVLHYQVGLFFLLEALFEVYFIFPGIVNGDFDLKNIWMDAMAVVSFFFFVGVTSMNIKTAKVQAEKLEYMQELQDGQRDIIQKFAEFSEAKSGETGQHIRRVSEYSAVLAKECGLSDDEVERIRIASMMHDFGKLLIPREILEKPGALTSEERKIMCQHTVYGKEILANSKGEVISMARDIAYEHHERWDGKGYPRGIDGNNISIAAQIVSVVDVYDALTSKRAYKEAWERNVAKKEIISQRGTQFSPRVVDAFVKSFDKINKIQDMYVD